MKKTLILLLTILLIPLVTAIQPTQEYSKIFLNPFYRNTMSLNTNYAYNITVTPPDGINKVLSAIISMDVYIAPTVNFSIFVNNQSCNTASYLISTTFASAGQARITFDCSNIITRSGTYNVTIRPTLANSGASTAWLDLTYMNNPVGTATISGTEYSPGDSATIFLQLINSEGNPVQNGSCYLNVYAPVNASNIHSMLLDSAPMLQSIGTDGIYYYDMVTPSSLGVYMLAAKCSYTYNWQWIYQDTDSINFPIAQINSGTWQGSAQVLNSKSDGLYERCDGSIASPCSTNYTFNLSTYGIITNITNINVYFAGESDTSSRTLVMAYWNGTTFVNLTNTLAWSGTGATTPTGYDEFLTNSIPLAAIINNTVRLRVSTAGSVRIFQNWLALAVLSSGGTPQELKGSSEMHVTNIPNATVTLVNNQTPAYIWNYTIRNLTFYPAQIDLTNYTNITASVWNYNGTIAINILSQIANSIWNYVARYTHGVISS